MNNKIKIASLFSGIGGFEYGFNNSKLNNTVIFASEIDKYAQLSYSTNFGANNLHGDITKISEEDIPNHDLLVAGFPCQAFSIAGKQRGFDDIRGTLFFDVARILKHKRPKYILLENVKNLISHDNGRTFKTIINTLNQLEYTVDFTIINSTEAGLPQNRERTFIFGVLYGKPTDLKFDKRSKRIDKIKKEFEYTGFDFFNTLKFSNSQKYIKDIIFEEKNNKYLITNDLIKDYLIKNNFQDGQTTNQIIKLFDLPKKLWNDLERQRRVYSINGISPTILARSDTTKIYIADKNSPYIRKFTPRENFKLQGFSDDFIDNILNQGNISMTQQYKQAGNAVSPPVITGIANHIKKYMEENNDI